LSELIIGIIPPEFFSYLVIGDREILHTYILYVPVAYNNFLFGRFAAFLFGRYLHNYYVIQILYVINTAENRIIMQEYGLYLITGGRRSHLSPSLHPMLVGSVHYPVRKYFYWSLSRFIKFAISAYVIWEANMI